MITIRLATTEDIDAVCRIEDACFDKPWSHLLIQRDIAENSHAMYWLAVDADKVVGFVGVHDVVGEINITNVAVDPAYRQQGIGTMLIAAMTQYFDDLKNTAASSGANDFANNNSATQSTEIKNSGTKNAGAEIIGITLEVRVSNAPAIRLYENFSFKEEGRRKGYYSDGEDALIMWRR